ncbi:glycosyltransferase [uncultured Methanobrevibacter sp.]|uniref:glycosyltransferase n=1 Tax=uncultured Methanobrevibacter sp. TaxID=253161 RepID=UPI0025E43A06|nr:glycosyltransferase [uncultured Methanobrevibacter sp.]
MRDFKFSIITCFYNSEKYLEESIKSIINQTLDFEEDIQLILVDDGSEDKSLDIALKYKELYSENISVLTQNHLGISYARNLGLKNVKGKYVNFLDSDDYISKNALKEVFNFFEENFDEMDVLSIPMHYVDRLNTDHVEYDFSNKNLIIDLETNPNNPLFSISSTFIKHEAIENLSFNNDLICSEDLLLLNKLLLNKSKYAILYEPVYYYRKRYDLSNFHENIFFENSFYNERVEKFHLKFVKECSNKYGFVPKFIQYSLLYDLITVIKQSELHLSENKFEFFILLNEFLQYIDDEVIFENKYIDNELKYFILYLKMGDIDNEIQDFNVISKIGDYTLDELNVHKFWYDNIEINENYLYISGIFNSYFDVDDLSVVAVKEKDGEYELFKGAYLQNDHHTTTRFLSVDWVQTYPFYFKIPTKDLIDSKIRIRINYHKNGDNSDFDWDNISFSYLDGKFTKGCVFSEKINNFIKDDIRVSFKDRSFFISRGFKFSVVMAIYNTENYVKDAIDSIINQTIGFENHIQLILIDDGSTDNTNNILLDYQKKYPENILVLTQENQGQATARNNGLKFVQGEYVNFLDSDDYLSEDAMEKAFPFLKKHEKEIDFVSIRQKHFGRKDSPHMLNYRFDKGDRIIDLIKNPNNPQLPCNSVFFKNNLFNEYKFPTNVLSAEDAIMVNKILFEKKKYGVLKDPVYYYRKREDLSSTIDLVPAQKGFFTDKLKYYFLELINYSIEHEGEVLKFIQCVIAYDLQWGLEEPNLDVLDTEQEKEEFWYYLGHILDCLDFDVVENNHNVKKPILKEFFVALKNKDVHTEVFPDTAIIKAGRYPLDRFTNHNLWLDIIEIHDGFLNMSGFVYSLFSIDSTSIGAVKEMDGGTEYYDGKYVKYTSRENLTYLGITWQYKYTFDIKIPVSKNDVFNVKLCYNYHINGDKNDFSLSNIIRAFLDIKFTKHANLSEISNYLIKDDISVLFKDKRFLIRPYSYLRMVKYESNVLSEINLGENNHALYAIFMRLLYLLLYPFVSRMHKKHPTYLFMDRIDDADDNATVLFEYAVSQRDNVNKYFVLSNKSKNFSKISKIGKTLNYGSFRHKMKYLFADKVISSHTYPSVINPFYTDDNEVTLYSGLINPDIYFIQHGVAVGDLSGWFSKFDKNVRLIVTSSDLERESFLQEGYNYDESIVHTLGIPRHDNLKNNDKKQILIIPTWRKYLRGSKSLFLSSDYFNSLNYVLNNEEFINLAEKNGYKIVFKPHPELEKVIDGEKYLDLLEIDERIDVVSDVSYQKLFEESSLLITDYSSVFFDFSYLKKPIIYYQPYDDYHYDKGYFDFETMGFGDIITEWDSLLSKIAFYLQNGCEMEEKYKQRVNNFFKHHDGKNSMRVYDWILKH